MAWNSFATPLIGKAVRKASRLAHGGGSAFPGKIVESIDPQFLSRTLAQLPLGVVLVSGTNGKTTTTRMVASMLGSLGLKVFTNPTGSNFTRGVVSALLSEVTLGGELDADIAVLELDEAYAVHFVRQVKPDYCLLLNVMRDQLDRFGEIDNTARLLSKAAAATTGTVVLNREDPRIARLADVVNTQDGVEVRYFGLDESLRRFFPSDDEMKTTVAEEADELSADAESTASSTTECGESTENATHRNPPSTVDKPAQEADALPADVTLLAVGDHHASFGIDGESYATDVKLEGVYNLYNAAAALAVVRAVVADAQAMFLPFEQSLSDADAAALLRQAGVSQRMIDFAHSGTQAMIDAAAEVTPAFGRGEVIDVDGSPVELLLVKNPMGFRLSLASFAPEGCDTMICINDEYADGRDMSWLWDVDFTSLRGTGVAMVSGVRAWDMALRLEYDQVPVETVDTELETSVERFVKTNPGKPKHIYCTYTAMLKARAALGTIAHVADAGVGR
ncbi:Mur ligase family protein [Bifidobacterium sp. UBA6881]|uniref:Mur ligase family protein n=1 Tax=Bifidobacterium sp. UBA6881 TaxID=1946109 RepID=UPI0025B8FAF8|nr:Mur ligase family protein [Bifidobacterium sp. UBA6881]